MHGWVRRSPATQVSICVSTTFSGVEEGSFTKQSAGRDSLLAPAADCSVDSERVGTIVVDLHHLVGQGAISSLSALAGRTAPHPAAAGGDDFAPGERSQVKV